MMKLRLEYKPWWIYGILIFLTIFFLFVSGDRFEAPTYSTITFFLFLGYLAYDSYMKALRMKAPACILESVDPESGGHTTIHPSDISIITSGKTDKEGRSSPSFLAFTTGGFISGVVALRGKEYHVICPPEHFEKIGNGYACRTKLMKLPFEKLPEYVQSELLKMPSFDLEISRKKNNILFGLTSLYDETSTDENRKFESTWIGNEYLANYYKNQAEGVKVTIDKLKPGEKMFIPVLEEEKK